MGGIGKGGFAALAGAALVAGIITYRTMDAADDAESTSVSGTAGMSLPPSFESLEARALANPDDPVGWQELGSALFGNNRFSEAAQAYERAVQADPDSAVLWSSLGEARVMASTGDPMPEAAEQAFRRAVELDAGDPRARYFLGVARDLTGDHEGAISDWLALLADTPPGAPWESDLVRTITQVGAINDIAVESRIAGAAGTRDILPAGMTGSRPGPTQEQMAAAASLAPDEQQSMAEEMTARLATRLENEGGSAQDWIMLMRSYNQLGRTGDARRARDSALAAHPDASAEINSAARVIGVR
ncbi:tetratricopeptide repeat protein [Erythrobacter alti]|uniref:tetratricopeptide repeat protein n=1 Tax=Erythrobacter alti TaxID=1896145 RepID=UPI0030F45295